MGSLPFLHGFTLTVVRTESGANYGLLPLWWGGGYSSAGIKGDDFEEPPVDRCFIPGSSRLFQFKPKRQGKSPRAAPWVETPGRRSPLTALLVGHSGRAFGVVQYRSRRSGNSRVWKRFDDGLGPVLELGSGDVLPTQ